MVVPARGALRCRCWRWRYWKWDCASLASGYDTAFFKVERDAAGKKFLIENNRFTFRFFPPELARWPGTLKLAAEKPAEDNASSSSASPPRWVIRNLPSARRATRNSPARKFPGQKFEVVNLGITAINLARHPADRPDVRPAAGAMSG